MLIFGGLVRLVTTTPTASAMSTQTVATTTTASSVATACASVSMYNILNSQDTIYSILGNFCFYCIL